MKAGVVVFPGSNCDQDMVDALQSFDGVQVQKLWHKQGTIGNFDLLVLPGGFSFGDYLRSGAIARFSPIMLEVLRLAKKGIKVLGVCNGFQILCEAGLTPGALLHNDCRKFICKPVWIKAVSRSAGLTEGLHNYPPLQIPIAHGEGKFFAPPDALKAIEDNDQVLFRYCHPDGSVDASTNPNGALNHIAGVCNKEKNVFGMMPHPERACDPLLGNIDGRKIMERLLQVVHA